MDHILSSTLTETMNDNIILHNEAVLSTCITTICILCLAKTLSRKCLYV